MKQGLKDSQELPIQVNGKTKMAKIEFIDHGIFSSKEEALKKTYELCRLEYKDETKTKSGSKTRNKD